MRSEAIVRASVRLYRFLLAAYPVEFRQAVGDDLLATWEDCVREASARRGSRGAAALWLTVLARFPIELAAEWATAIRSRRARRRKAVRPGSRGRREDSMAAIIQDIRYAARSFSRNPAFVLVAVVTLGLGVGGSTTIFSVVDGVVIRDLPYDDPEELVVFHSFFGDFGTDAHSPPNFVDVRERTRTLEAVAAIEGAFVVLDGEGEPRRLETARISGELFALLGVPPAIGRVFDADDHRDGAPATAVLGHGAWRSIFGADPGVIGRAIRLDGREVTVVGVTPQDFVPPELILDEGVDVWLPRSRAEDTDPERRDSYFLAMIGRVGDGVGLGAVREEMTALGAALAEEHPDANTYEGHPLDIQVIPLRSATVGDVGGTMIVLAGAVALLLLIACANIANLFLARGTTRQREMAVRVSLGAGRMRLVRQLLTESLILSVLAGGVGVLLAVAGVAAFKALDPGNIPRMAQVAVDARVLSFALLLSMLTGVIFGLTPAIQLSGVGASPALRTGGRTASAARATGITRAILVAAQTALAVILVTGAGLLINSFVRLVQVDPGFEPEGVIAMQVRLGPTYESTESWSAFFAQLHERARAIPGARSASLVTRLPMTPGGHWGKVTVLSEGTPVESQGFLRRNDVTEDYFQTLGIPVSMGRAFHRGERGSVIVNQAFATENWKDADPFGRQLKLGRVGSDLPWRTVVGVVGTVHQRGLGQAGEPEIYLPFWESPEPAMYAVVRGSGEPGLLAPAMRRAVWSLDAGIPVDRLLTMEEAISATLTSPRFYASLLASFAAIALVLAAVGVYGTVSYSVERRTRELGIRMALGAKGGDILSLVVRHGMTLSLLGIGLGLAGAAGATRLLESFVFGIGTLDPATFAFVVALLGAVALLACYIPARRAVRADPVATLRSE